MLETQALDTCMRITRRHSSTFFLGSRLFPPRQRQAVRVIYALCRSGDDTVDEAGSPLLAAARLRDWWSHVERAYQGTPCRDQPLELALHWVLRHYPVPRKAFEELRLGFEADLAPAQPETLEELMVYCRRVAGVVGLLVAPIAGYRGGDETLDYAVALGNAMQLTNILRDVGEDLERGRCYLPKELMDRHQVTCEQLRRGEVGPNYVALLEELSEMAHGLYRLGWRGIPRLNGTAAVAVGVAALNYEGILRKLRQNRYDNLTRRAYLRPLERIALIPRALLGVYSHAP